MHNLQKKVCVLLLTIKSEINTLYSVLNKSTFMVIY